MAEFRHGLIIGKFYPPTPGHQLLIEAALARCAAVTVLVEHSSVESIPGSDRARWIQRMAPAARVIAVPCDIPIDLGSDAVWQAQTDVIASAIRYRAAGGLIDALFSSDAYGDELAARLGAMQGRPIAHIPVDPPRAQVPISATAVRADLAGHWSILHPAVRAGLAVRVCVIGAESTGTTTLAQDLAGHYAARGGPWARTRSVPEHGRQYTRDMLADARAADPAAGMDDLVWTGRDFAAISTTQTEMEDAAAADSSPLLVCDTDALATAVWERRYIGETAGRLADRFPVPAKGIYLLTDHRGVPFEQDGIRDGEHLRERMTGWFERTLVYGGRSYALMTGTREERLALAVRITDQLLDQRAALAAPMK